MGENTFFISLVSMLYLTECVFFFNLTRSVNCYSSPSSLGIRHVFQSLKPLQLIRGFFFYELDVYDRGGERTKLHHKQIASKTGHIWRSF